MTAPRNPADGPAFGRADEASTLAWFDALYRKNAFAILFGEGDQITAANDALLALLGWTREAFEAAPPTWRTITPGAGTAEDEAANLEAIETGTWAPLERTWIRRDGTTVPVVIGGTVYDRERFRWVAYAFDISRQRDAEQALVRSEERFALAVRGSSDGIWDWDLSAETVYLSARAASILGQGETDQVRPGGAMHALLHPDDVGEWHARMRAHFKHRTPYRQELRLRRPDGLWQWVAARGEATFAGDRAVRMAGTLSDIQARKEAEQRLVESERRLALAMRATSDGVIEFVVGHDHAWCSARTAAILELEEIPDGGVVPWTRVIVGQPPSEVVRQQAALASSLATGAVYDVTIQRQRLDGSTQWLRVRGFPDRTTEGADVRFVASISDITADVAAQVALRASEARLWQAQKMDALGTLASGIAHDFNNLLAVILGYVEVGLAGQPTGLADRALREIGVAGRRARDLVGQMLSFSRQSESAGAIGGPGAAVAAAIEETTHYVAATKTPQVAVTVTIADDVPPVAVDDSALQQVLLNLAMNGVHAMRERGGVLTLGADIVATDDPLDGGSRELSPGRYVRLRVSDTGCGIPPELLDRVVEPFFTTKSHGEGTGLGLSVVHGVVSSSGGAMRIRSAVGAGTTVELLLPVAAGVADERPMPTTDPFGAPIDGHVLVVDDDPAVADVTAERLRLAGCRVTVRLDAASALEVLAAIDANEGRERHDAGPDPVHLVLADWSMPEHSGEWLLARIRERWPALPVALMSGHRSAEGTARVLAAGGVALLEKPVEPAALAAVLRRLGTPTADTAAAGA